MHVFQMHRTYNSFSPVDGGNATPSQFPIEREEEPMEQSKALISVGSFTVQACLYHFYKKIRKSRRNVIFVSHN